jgi:hypothetical protein
MFTEWRIKFFFNLMDLDSLNFNIPINDDVLNQEK